MHPSYSAIGMDAGVGFEPPVFYSDSKKKNAPRITSPKGICLGLRPKMLFEPFLHEIQTELIQVSDVASFCDSELPRQHKVQISFAGQRDGFVRSAVADQRLCAGCG